MTEKEMVLSFIKSNKIPLIAAFAHWLITTFLCVDKLFFYYEERIDSFFYIVKILYLFFLLVAYCFGNHVFRKVKEKDPFHPPYC